MATATRGLNLDALARTVCDVESRLKDRLETAVILEALGYKDEDAREHGFRNLFDLAEGVRRVATPYAWEEPLREAPRKRESGFRLYLAGMFYNLGWVIMLIALFLGGLKSRKNLFLLLDIWREVARQRADARLVVAGAGPLLRPLRRYAGRSGLERSVVFTGYVPEEEKVDYYNLADVLLFPSAMEGFGLGVAEAMACELPVVVSDRGSLPEVVADEEGGFLCDPDAPEAFVRRVLLLLSEPLLRRKFGLANRERVDRVFRWDHCAAATERVYEEVLDAWRRRRAQAR